MTDAAPAVAEIDDFADRVVSRVARGARFCGLFASPLPSGARLLAVLDEGAALRTETLVVPEHPARYRALTPRLPAAAWYEREIHDLFGVEPVGHGRLDALVLPRAQGAAPPRPGAGGARDAVALDTTPLPAHVTGEGVFTIPYGPVRSGVFESVEYLVETPGEDIPHLRTRVFYKHRGIEARFEGMSLEDGALLAERYEGVASVAHAIAYCGALEQLAHAEVPEAASLVRVLHAELERIANHLDSVLRHTEGAGLAVAYARFSLHKERLQQLRGRLCGSRFGRGVVVPGGVSGAPLLGPDAVLGALDRLERAVHEDLTRVVATPSFVDRLRATGVIPLALAHEHGALGPVGRASGQMADARLDRPYAAYGRLGLQPLEARETGDALARQQVRHDEIASSFHLVHEAIDRLDHLGDVGAWAVPIDQELGGEELGGEAIGWAEAPQGEVLYLVAVDGGHIVRVKPRSASFHNLGLFHLAFPKDIFTDFVFIEASFGLSIAGVAG